MVIGLASAAPEVATEKLKVAALPAGTTCEVEPAAVMEKSEAAPTTMFELAEVLGRKFVSPEYAAVRVCIPSASALVLIAAPPAESGIVESAFVPSSSVMFPVGTPVVALAAHIVNVSGRPRLGVLIEADSAVSVGACAMLRLAGGSATV
jgi:hypothetical protein